jgi:hypothetical protein
LAPIDGAFLVVIITGLIVYTSALVFSSSLGSSAWSILDL